MAVDTDIANKLSGPKGYTEPSPPMTKEVLAAFKQVIETRRSVRIFDGTPVPEHVMNDCIDMALLAPNSSNLQAWEFYWVRSPEKKARMVEACLSQPAAKTAAEIVMCVARTKTWQRNAKLMIESLKEWESKGNRVPQSAKDYYTKLVPLMYSTGPLNITGTAKKVGLFITGLKKPIPREPTTEHDMQVWAVKTCSLAAENLMLAFRAHGFDTCPMEGLDSYRVAKILDLPSDAVVVMGVAIGKRAPNGIYGPRVRFDRSLFVKEV